MAASYATITPDNNAALEDVRVQVSISPPSKDVDDPKPKQMNVSKTIK